MEIFNGFQYYDIGHLIYDLWLVIDVLFWCTLITIVLKMAASRSIKLVWDKAAYVELASVVVSVLVLVNISSFPIKIGFAIAVLLAIYLLKKDRLTLIIALICLPLGFGYTLIPVIAAFIYGAIRYFSKKRNLAKG